MKKLCVIFIATIFCISCKEEKKSFLAPVSDLGHVDLILDSSAFFAILQDIFLTNQFAVVTQDTTMYSKPSYDLYMLGSEAFLHVSLAKEYWENMAGSAVMIFQTRRPGKGDSLRLAWKQFFNDSLDSHTFKGADFDLDEIMPYRKKDTTKTATPNFTSLLTSYSTQGYKNWGFNDSNISNGLSMNSFLQSWDASSQKKLFGSIKSLHVQIVKKEFAEMESALYAVGYTHHNDHFMHEFNPKIYYTVTDSNTVPKYKRIEIALTESTAERKIQLGTMYSIHVKGNEMVIEQTIQ